MSNKSVLTAEQRDVLAQLQEVEKALAAQGFCLVRHVAVYVKTDSSYFSTRISLPFTAPDPMFDHSVMDAIRDIGVEWHNTRHKDGDRLQWEDAE